MYLILMNPQDNPHSYLGAICIIDDSPWYITGKQGPDLFLTDKEAEKTIKELQKLRPKVKFEVMSVGDYLAIVKSSSGYPCEWMKKMKERFAE